MNQNYHNRLHFGIEYFKIPNYNNSSADVRKNMADICEESSSESSDSNPSVYYFPILFFFHIRSFRKIGNRNFRAKSLSKRRCINVWKMGTAPGNRFLTLHINAN